MEYIKPYSDERMTWDDYDRRYYLTEESLKKAGLDLRGRYTAQGVGDPGAVIQSIIRICTDTVYGYMHGYAFRTDLQDAAIATIEEARRKIYAALMAMIVPLARYGDRRDSVEKGERDIAIPEGVKNALSELIPGLGHSLIYSGRWTVCPIYSM